MTTKLLFLTKIFLEMFQINGDLFFDCQSKQNVPYIN